ncbi:hypothetical protein [Streptomyces sp. bgisy032]|uniref:hypothetical protein n=1 Tax=Streptomyces sp. bgisy032 TaxID=3413773 RepID=UPI003D71FB18
MNEAPREKRRNGLSGIDARDRVTAVLMMCGLLAGAWIVGRIGLLDAGGALSYLGRMTGFLMLAAAAMAALGAVAVFDFWGKRSNRLSGPVVLLAVLTVLVADFMLLAVQIQGGEFTPYLVLWITLGVWSVWALWVMLHRERVWSQISAPRSFAIGVFITGLVAVANFSYSQIYQPYTAPQLVLTRAKFGESVVGEEGYARIIVHAEFKNEGKVAAHLIHASYSVTGRKAVMSGKPTSSEERLQALVADQEMNRDVDSVARTVLKVGRLLKPGFYLEPGESVSEERLIELPKGKLYDALELEVHGLVARKDRLVLGVETRRHPWKADEVSLPDWITPEGDPARGSSYAHYTYNVTPSNTILEFTRRPVHLDLWWVFGPYEPILSAALAGKGEESVEPSTGDWESWFTRYGLSETTSGRVELPLGG